MVRYMKEQEKQGKSDSSPRDKKRSLSSAENVKAQGGNLNKTASGTGNLKTGDEANTRVLRITPSHIDWDASKVAVAKFEPPKMAKEMTFDEKRLKYMRNLLRLQVERIHRIDSNLPTSSKEYEKYEFNWNQLVRKGEHSQMFTVKHREFSNLPMIVKRYENTLGNSAVFSSSSLYLKCIKHLGKKHPYITQTWEVFAAQNQILVVQEFANRNDVSSFLKLKGKQNEQRVCEWAHQLYKALDYLGDMAICHRAIKPKNILLNHKELSVRLTGFKNAVVYWNVAKEDISNLPCLPVSSKNRSNEPDFQAPEVFGNDEREEFDPIKADLFSYGAVIFSMITIFDYPYNWKVDNMKVEDEIRNSVQKLDISEEGKSFLNSLLTTNAIVRLTFDKINSNPWFALLKHDNVVSSLQKLA